MKNKSFFTKSVSGKNILVFTTVSFCLILVVTLAVYRASISRLRDILTPGQTEVTEQVRHNEDSITDPRYLLSYEDEDTTGTEQETSVGWTMPEERETTRAVTQEETEPAISNDSYIFPVDGELLQSFSPDVPLYNETMGDWRVHTGTDFGCEEKAEILSAGNGRVVKVVADKGYGYTVEIDHGDFIVRYCGLEQGTTLRIDDTVSKGDRVGVIGSVPCESRQGCHLHLEVIKNGKHIDPMIALKND